MASILLTDGIRLLSGPEANRASVIPDVGEPLVTTDERRMFIGDNATGGGNELAYRGTNHVSDIALQAATPATPAAGHSSDIFVQPDGTAHYVTADGLDHQLAESVGLAKSYQVVSPSRVAPAEDLTVRASTTTTIAVNSGLIVGRNLTERRPFTTDSFSLSADVSGEAAGWKDIWFMVRSPGATAVARSLVVTDHGTLPANQTDEYYYAFLSTFYMPSNGTLRLFAQRGNIISVENTTAVSNGTSTAWTNVDLSTLIPTTGKTVNMRVELLVWAAQFTALRVASSLAQTTLGRRNFSVNTGPMTSASFSNTTAGRFAASSFIEVPILIAQSVVYQVSAANCRANLIVQGYTL